MTVPFVRTFITNRDCIIMKITIWWSITTKYDILKAQVQITRLQTVILLQTLGFPRTVTCQKRLRRAKYTYVRVQESPKPRISSSCIILVCFSSLHCLNLALSEYQLVNQHVARRPIHQHHCMTLDKAIDMELPPKAFLGWLLPMLIQISNLALEKLVIVTFRPQFGHTNPSTFAPPEPYRCPYLFPKF